MKHYDVDPRKLSEVFDNVSSTYKFYWMLSLLDIVSEGRAHQKVTFAEMVARMISKAWTPLTRGLFSFGKCDKLSARIHQLIFSTELHNCDTEERVRNYIIAHASDPVVAKICDQMTKYVPYRFLYPWLGYNPSNGPIELESQDFDTYRCPYCIEGKSIRINPAWVEYLTDHYEFFSVFAKYLLTYYLMGYNDNIVLPEEICASVTADGSSTSFNHQMGLASEPITTLYEANAQIALLKQQLRNERLSKKTLMSLVANMKNELHFGAGSSNTIITGGAH